MNNQKVSFEELFPLMEEKMKNGESFSFLAFGDSMLPFLKNGKDLVTLSPVTKTIRKNDVIFYRRENGQFVLHRVIKTLPGGKLWLCGDNQLYIERGISSEQVIAVLTGVVRNGKNVSLSSFSYRLYLVFLTVKRNIRLFYYRAKNKISRILKQK